MVSGSEIDHSPGKCGLNHLSGDDPIPSKCIGYPPQLCIYIPNLFHVGRGPSSVLRVRRRDPSFALRGPWACGLAAVHAAPVPVRDDGVLAGCPLACFGQAPLTRPVGPEPRATARFDELFSVS